MIEIDNITREYVLKRKNNDPKCIEILDKVLSLETDELLNLEIDSVTFLKGPTHIFNKAFVYCYAKGNGIQIRFVYNIDNNILYLLDSDDHREKLQNCYIGISDIAEYFKRESIIAKDCENNMRSLMNMKGEIK